MTNKFDYVKTRRDEVDAIPVKWQGTVQRVMKHLTRFNVWVYKKSNGRLMKNFPGGFPICIVGMTGKRSGERREIALIHLPWGDKKLLVASQGGMEKHPLWYFNIAANPKIDIMVAGNTQNYLARQANAEEKRELWPHLLSLYPDFDQYQARTDRDIPVFICTLATD
ncbi:nitroreductase family deazaflavin-dependent oxidoreductase [Zhongshania sp.]|uniref:nitroreductase family deazaflavin-dependent oxidoreductase n=1 Tax=Zhongshania sp. TaxID=1971902 RepID=UPI0035696382